MKIIKSKKVNILLLSVFAIALIAFIIGSIYDWDIANKIHVNYPFKDDTKVNAPWFAVVLTSGIIPTCFFGTFAAVAMLFCEIRIKFLNVFWKVCGVIGAGVIAYSTFDSCLETVQIYNLAQSNKNQITVFILLTIIIVESIAIMLAIISRKEVNKKRLLWVCLTMLFATAFYLLFSDGVKYIVSRPRPRTIYNVPAQETFRSWWEARPFYGLINPVGGACKSFPSGHVANVTTYILTFPLFMSLFNVGEKKWTAFIAVAIASAYTFLVAISRMFAQAHFLSDVAGAILLSLIIMYLLFFIMSRIEEKVESSKEAK